jgi:hypothetical protein
MLQLNIGFTSFAESNPISPKLHTIMASAITANADINAAMQLHMKFSMSQSPLVEPK